MYQITIANLSGVPRVITEADGSAVLRLDVDERQTIYCSNPCRALAAYERIELLPKAPWAECVLRSGFQPPAMKWPTLFVNKGEGRSPWVVTRMVNGAMVHFMKGVPIRLDVDPREEWALFERVDLNCLVETMVKSAAHQGYMQKEVNLKDRGHDRSLAELAVLEEHLNSLKPAEENTDSKSDNRRHEREEDLHT